MKIIVLFGPPGCGKGTQAEKMIEYFNYLHFSTGDMLRNEVKNETEIGKKVKQIMNSGQLVSDDIVVEIIKKNIIKNKNKNGVILDGFPRTVVQADKLNEILKELNLEVNNVISLKVNEKELTKRILKRGETSGRKDDQSEELIKARVEEYISKTSVLEDYYNKLNIVSSIDGMKSIDEVFEDIKNKI